MNDDAKFKVFFWLATATSLCFIVYLLRGMMAPFVIAGLMAYLADPLADKLEARGLSRTLAVIIIFSFLAALIVAVLLFLIPLLAAQMDSLLQSLPTIIEWFYQQTLPFLQSLTGLNEPTEIFNELKSKLSSDWQSASGFLGLLVSNLTRSGYAVIAWLGAFALVPVVAFFMLRDWDVFVAQLLQILPRSRVDQVKRLATQCDTVLGEFLRGQLLIMLLLGLIYAVGLSIIGIDLALLLGLSAGLASIVPYLGVVVGILLAGIAALAQFQEWIYLLAVLLVFGVGQLLESLFLTPILVGDKIGLHPVVVIFAILAGGQLFGFVGVLLALPVTAILSVLAAEGLSNYKASHLYNDELGQSSQKLKE